MEEFKEIEISKIKSLENVRARIKETAVAELMQSIKQQGLLQPIGVWVTKEQEYVVAYGNRRLVACEKLGWKTITCKVLGELTYEDMLIINTTENIHRKDVSLAEIGRICSLLEERGLSQSEIASRLGVTASKVSLALGSFKKIPAQHREDIVYMIPGTKRKAGKIPASSFNSLLAIQREQNLNTADFNKLIKIVKQKDYAVSQINLLALLLHDGASVNEALLVLDEYVVRRVSLPLKKSVELKMLEENGLEPSGKLAHFFRKILRGEIQGRKDLVY